MDIEAMRRSPIGELVPIGGTDPRTGEPWSYWAFVPAPLPTAPSLGMRAHDVATRAAMEVARLDQAVLQHPNPDILVRPIIRREAVSTSALEGTFAAFEDVLEADFTEERNLSSEQREIRNYVRASERAVELLKTYPISRTLVGQLQSIIVRGTPGESYDAGDLRKRQVYIGPKSRPIEEARFVPPPPGDALENGFSDWEKWVNSTDPVPIIIRIALAHYQFESLHPYADGNGRLGRLIAIMQLLQEEYLGVPILNISPWLEQRRDEYLEKLLRTTIAGDFNDWVIFLGEAVRVQAREGVDRINRLLDLRDRMVADLRAANVRGTALQIAEILIGYPFIDVSTASRLTSRTFQAANVAVSTLVQQGILREITGRTQGRLFVCDQALRIITS